jgi:hypothetical protein
MKEDHLNTKYTIENALEWREEMRKYKLSLHALSKRIGIPDGTIRRVFNKYEL